MSIVKSQHLSENALHVIFFFMNTSRTRVAGELKISFRKGVLRILNFVTDSKI